MNRAATEVLFAFWDLYCGLWIRLGWLPPLAIGVLACGMLFVARGHWRGRPISEVGGLLPLRGRWLRLAASGAATLLALAAGLGLGALGLCFLTDRLYSVFDPVTTHDGQYVMVFIIPAAFGSLSGGAALTAVALLCLGQRRPAGWVCLVSGSGLVALLASLGVDDLRSWLENWLSLPGEGAPLLWAVLLVAFGAALFWRRRPRRARPARAIP